MIMMTFSLHILPNLVGKLTWTEFRQG